MSQLIPQDFGQVSTKFVNQQVEDDLSSGIQSSFGIVGYKGKVWSIRYRGEENKLMRDDGDGPRSSIEVVLLRSSKHVSKVFYKDGYVEGSTAAPDCFSNNGISPDPTSANKQSETCALCPHNQWGSRITPAGKNGKACQDSKRVAVAPLQDINNEMFGGPMLLRIPAASLQDLAMYGQKMQQMGYPYFSVGTRIQFDPSESYPKLKFSAIRPLSDEESDVVFGARDGHTTERILSENEFAASVDTQTQQSPEQVFEQPPAQATQQAEVTSTGNPFAAAAKAEPAEVADDEAAKKAAELADKKAKLAQMEKELAEQEPKESDEDREMRELEEKMAALAAKKAAAKATEVKAAPKPTKAAKAATPAETKTIEASPVEVVEQVGTVSDGNMASDFEANLDNMLSELLPDG